jgi:PIN domain nuclease of toxin-antitoxin system
MRDLLLDSSAMLWIANGAEMAPESRKPIVSRNLHVSPISAWEIADLVRRSGIAFTVPVKSWSRQVSGKMAAEMLELTAEILADSCDLPGSPLDDPADHIIIATAREGDMAIVTRDRHILEYARAGHVRALEC